MNASQLSGHCPSCGFAFRTWRPPGQLASCPQCSARVVASKAALFQEEMRRGRHSTLQSVLDGACAGALAVPLLVASLGAIACGLQRGIPMVSIPNPIEAAVMGFVFTICLLGMPAAIAGAALGGIYGWCRS